MEHKLFQTKLKSVMDSDSLFKVIKGSSLGEHPYRATVMQLIVERSIEERRKRMTTKVNDTPQSDPGTTGETTIMTTIIPTQQAEKPRAVPQLLSSTSVSVSTTSAKEKSPKNSMPVPMDDVRLVCGQCNGELLWFIGLHCLSCPPGLMKCSGCGSK